MAETPAPKKAPARKKPAAPRKPKAATVAVAAAEAPKAKFAKAIEDAKAGVQTLKTEAQAKAEVYREKAAATGGELLDEAKAIGNQARERAAELAVEGKAKASDAIAGIGQIVAENAPAIDEKLGPKYGDYARSAARTMQETAARLEAKDLNELGDDAKEFVRKKPGLAVGLAAVAGFMIARLFKKSDS